MRNNYKCTMGNVTNFTIDGKCSECGKCCSDFLPISSNEIKTIRRYIKKNHIKEVILKPPVDGPILDVTCPFRDDDKKKYLIYPVRPSICREFKCDLPYDDLLRSKEVHHRKYKVVNMRAEFYPREEC